MRLPAFIKRLARICDSSNGRYALSGLKCESDGETAKLTATDGHVLACVHWHDKDAVELDVVASPKPLSQHAAKAYTTGIGIRFDGETLRGGATGSVETIDGKFPDYERVFPDSLEGYASVRLDAGLLGKLCDLSRDMNDSSHSKGITLFVKDGQSCAFATTTSEDGHVARFAIMPRAADDKAESHEWPKRPGGAAAAESAMEDERPAPPPELMDDEQVADAIAEPADEYGALAAV